MMNEIHFLPPPGFEPEEVIHTWRSAAVDLDRRLPAPQLQIPIRPNATLHRRAIDPAVALEDAVASISRTYLEALGTVREIEAQPIEFADGAKGLLLEIWIPALPGVDARQLQVFRIDRGMLTTITLCTESSRLDARIRAHYIELLKSARVIDEDGGRP
jgi:hypothetical protein